MLRERINSFFKRRGGDLIILVFSLLLAFFMWSMYRLTGNYSAVLDYRVEIKSNITGHSSSAISRNALVIRGEASGFFIFQQRSDQSSGQNIITLEIDSKRLKRYRGSDDLYYLVAQDVEDPVQEFFGSDLELDGVSSDTLLFYFPKQASRKVPVIAKYNITFESQYASPSEITTNPDSVVIYGDESLISTIEFVQTQSIKHASVDEPVQGVVKLRPIRGVNFSSEEVYYALPVVRYFEGSIEMDLEGENFPSGANVLFVPQTVTLFYRMPVDARRAVGESDFYLSVDYDSIRTDNIVRPRVTMKPEGLFDVRVEPRFVECFVN